MVSRLRSFIPTTPFCLDHDAKRKSSEMPVRSDLYEHPFVYMISVWAPHVALLCSVPE